MIPLNIIIAIDTKNGIGKDDALPWDLTADLEHFRAITSTTRSPKKKNVVVMGRKTWDSIPQEYRPLPNRMNIILTQNKGLRLPEGVLKADSFDQVLQMANNEKLKNIIETIFVIGGQQVYEWAVKCPECEKLYVTHIHSEFDCDAFFPPFEDIFESIQISEESKEGMMTYHFQEYKRKDGSAS
ncbi:MAG: dihydrofolate reductase [Candidatus Omnitrophica bacterium]|nr:dihydrofolate reductase [Candidatus Omnitrophota bacterium]